MPARCPDSRTWAGRGKSQRAGDSGRRQGFDDQLHGAGSHRVEVYAMRTCTELCRPRQNGGQYRSSKKRKRQRSGHGWRGGGVSSFLLPPNISQVHNILFQNSLLKRLCRPLSPWNGRLPIHTSLLALVAFRVTRLNLSWK